MTGICKDCQQARETKDILVVKPVLAIAFSSRALEQVRLCVVCALKRGITDWGSK